MLGFRNSSTGVTSQLNLVTFSIIVFQNTTKIFQRKTFCTVANTSSVKCIKMKCKLLESVYSQDDAEANNF